jgi:hypothetical protein
MIARPANRRVAHAIAERLGHERVGILDFLGLVSWIDGTPMLDHVEPYRRRIFEAFDAVDAGGRARYNLGLVGRAKKNWKSADLVLKGLAALLANESPHGNVVYLLANDEGQADDDLALAKKIVAASPLLRERLLVKKKGIDRRDSRGFCMILPAQDEVGQHGKSYRAALFDELHGYRDWDLLEAMQLDPTRPDAQMWITSYASIYHRPGVPLFDLTQQGRAGADPRLYFSWYAADFTTDAAFAETDPESRANPSRGSWHDADYLAQQQRRLPAHKYRRLHLNLGGLPEGSAFQVEPVMDAIARGIRSRAPEPGVAYVAFVDMSGGSSDDAVLAIAHAAPDGRLVLDRLLNQGPPPPFDPRAAVARFAGVVREYAIGHVYGDKYAGETFIQDFARHGIGYVVAASTASALYEAFEPIVNAREAGLLDVPLLEQQLLGLLWRGGKIDHPAGEHDDWANAAVGALLASREALTGADPAAAYEMGAAERAQILALQRAWGLGGAGLYDAAGHRLEDDGAFDDDRGLALDDPRYPRW